MKTFTPKQRIVDIELVDLRLIEPTNDRLNEEVVDQIVAEGWDQGKGRVMPAYFNGKKFVITDGNHRLEALRRLRHRFAPVVQLTKDEFDYVKYSSRSVDLLVRTPEEVKVYELSDALK